MIKAQFTGAGIAKVLQKKVDNINKAVFDRLSRVGEKFVTNARDNDTYKDQTDNLRSSIGYIILKDGVQLQSNFQGKNQVGVGRGRQVAEEVADQYPKGWVFIGVAGMDYAAKVEKNGYDVITASSIIAENNLRKGLASLSKKIPLMK